MPFTPFHFGPGLFVKSLAPRYFSWSAFVATQVVIDCETLYNLVQRTYPVHRALHTLAGATLAGLATSAALIVGKRIIGRIAPNVTLASYKPFVRSETSTTGLVSGGIIGGLSHSLLDSLMHRDVRPLAPWSDTNPFLHLIGVDSLYVLCIALGLIGLAVMGIASRRTSA